MRKCAVKLCSDMVCAGVRFLFGYVISAKESKICFDSHVTRLRTDLPKALMCWKLVLWMNCDVDANFVVVRK